MFTIEEKIQIIKWYYSGNASKEIQVLFSKTFEKRPVPAIQTILHTAHKFDATGCLYQCRRCMNKGEIKVRKIPERQKLKESKICLFVEENPTCTSTQISQQLGIQARTVLNILHRNGYKNYKINNSLAMSEADYKSQRERLKFCDDILKMINADKNFTQNILFTREYCFTLNNHQSNSADTHYWTRDTNSLSVPSQSSNQERLYMWIGILGDYVIGPFYINNHLTDDEYLLIMEKRIVPSICSLDVSFEKIWLQYDSSLFQNLNSVTLFLKMIFSDQIISKDGTICWPSKSTDLSPSIFFIAENIEHEVFKNHTEKPSNLEELKAKISEALNKITPLMLANVRQDFCKRVEKCKAQKGGEF